MRKVIANSLGFHIHDWKYIKKRTYYEFEGEQVYKLRNFYRKCVECGQMQEDRMMTDGIDVYNLWQNLTQQETDVLERKMEDKGDYYEINNK